jgi:hypothetical protein
LFNVNEFTVCPPDKTDCVPVNRTLLVADAPANVMTCSCQFIDRSPTTGSYTPNPRFAAVDTPSNAFTTSQPPTIPFVFVVNPAALAVTNGFAPISPPPLTSASVAPVARVNVPPKFNVA